MTNLTRRSFVNTAASTVAIPTVLTRMGYAHTAANDRITLGFIGLGMMGRGHLGAFLGYQDCQVVALADVVKERLEDSANRVNTQYKSDSANGVATYADYREIIARDDIDAVVIATPDHWHAIPVIQAANAGKDIYCEKPLTHNVVEGRKIVEACTKNKTVFQVGSQQRSEFGGRFRRAVELVRNGRVGKIHTVRIGVGAPNKPCDLPAQNVPDGTDWDFWLGPAPQRPYNEVLCPKGIHSHFPQWRAYREYAGGAVADMGAHHFDIAQWALGMDHTGPVKVEPPKDGSKSGLKLTYANGVEMYHGGPADVTFEGTEGTLMVSRGSIKSNPGSILEEEIGDDEFHVYPSNNHKRNFVDCVKSRKETICPAEIGHRTASICHLTNLGYQLGRPLNWDPKKEQFIRDKEANGYLWRKPRDKWDVI